MDVRCQEQPERPCSFQEHPHTHLATHLTNNDTPALEQVGVGRNPDSSWAVAIANPTGIPTVESLNGVRTQLFPNAVRARTKTQRERERARLALSRLQT